MAKTKPIPVKFDPPERNLITGLNEKTGLCLSEIIRRSVRLLGLEIKARGGNLAFIIEELGPQEAPPEESQSSPKVAEQPEEKKDIGFHLQRGGGTKFSGKRIELVRGRIGDRLRDVNGK